MHKSRLAGFIIDCHTDDLEAAARFWSAALGLKVSARRRADPLYRTLDTAADEVHIEVQQVTHPSRVHLDIEADDIEAEVRRLEKLGARRIGAGQDLVRHGGAHRAALLRGAACSGADFAAEGQHLERLSVNRSDIHFPPKHEPLRDDVHALGALVGEILREQGGQQLFELVELDRIAAIRAPRRRRARRAPSSRRACAAGRRRWHATWCGRSRPGSRP